ncbi:cytochrome c biogenesis protein CcdA [Candidatus Uhrbacteria bacterium]|nr:cytochrome c biogenesis protein CcdA [Candidatus Uhrbacteria bacterium]
MELLLTASIVAAFIAGVAALFAPCCITVLLPAYFASIFRERYKVFLMTFIFFMGILAVFLPIGLGAAALGQFFSRYHNTIFGIGGVLLIALGLVLLTGRHFSLPFSVNPTLKRHNAFSVFVLGVFSGIATTCCAPVLAGVLALAALPGSMLWGGIYTLSYVFGMVAPLFLISLFLDKVDFSQKFNKTFHKPITYPMAGKKITITVSEAISGLTFLVMGILIGYLALTNRLFVHSEYQVNVNIFLTKILNSVNGLIKAVPEEIWAILLLAIVALIIKSTVNQFKKEKYGEK